MSDLKTINAYIHKEKALSKRRKRVARMLRKRLRHNNKRQVERLTYKLAGVEKRLSDAREWLDQNGIKVA